MSQSTNMDCTDIKANLSPFLDGELTDERRHAAERHLAECQACRVMIDAAEKQDALMIAAMCDDAGSLPAGFEDAVLGRTVHARRRTVAARMRTWAGWIAAAAVLAVSVSPRLFHQPRDRAGGGDVVTANLASSTNPNTHVLRSFTATSPAVIEGPDHRKDPAMLVVNEVPSYSVIDQPVAESRRAPEPVRPPVASASVARVDPDRRAAAEVLVAVANAFESLDRQLSDAQTYAPVEFIRSVAEYDNLPARWAAVRDQLPADDRVISLTEEFLDDVIKGRVNDYRFGQMHNAVYVGGLHQRLQQIAADLLNPAGKRADQSSRA